MKKTKNTPVGRAAGVTANREYKSSVFSMLYDDPKKLLSLYNALNHSHYKNPKDLEIVTLKNAVYMAMKNDKAFLLDYRLNLYEHQSTPNPNMPLRDLFYVSREYEKMVVQRSLYRSAPIRIPAPRFVVFYNGLAEQPERQVLKLSDLYEQREEEPMLELKVEFLNINPGYNEQLKEACESLRGYCLFVERIREYAEEKVSLDEAVDQAVRECIREGILEDFLLVNRAEVVAMSILEFDMEKDWELLRKEEREIARAEVREIALKEGEAAGKKRQKENDLQILVATLRKYIPDVEEIYREIVSNEEYKGCTKEQIEEYFKR